MLFLPEVANMPQEPAIVSNLGPHTSSARIRYDLWLSCHWVTAASSFPSQQWRQRQRDGRSRICQGLAMLVRTKMLSWRYGDEIHMCVLLSRQKIDDARMSCMFSCKGEKGESARWVDYQSVEDSTCKGASTMVERLRGRRNCVRVGRDDQRAVFPPSDIDASSHLHPCISPLYTPPRQ
jgi:hypothetical protein